MPGVGDVICIEEHLPEHREGPLRTEVVPVARRQRRDRCISPEMPGDLVEDLSGPRRARG